MSFISGWGRTAATPATVRRPGSSEELSAMIADSGSRGVIARGLGRAYGDAAQNAGGTVIDCTTLPPYWSLADDVVTASAGMSLHELMRELVPRGWFVPVTPGTRYVTVGGAVAADIHGKNHHVDSSFGAHVTSLTVITADGERRTLTPGDELFWATVGGMGLTGIITEASFRCIPIETSRFRVDTERARDLDDVLARMAAGDDAYRYTVTWIDLVARGVRMGRGVLTRGHHAVLGDLPARKRDNPLAYGPKPLLTAPRWAPNGLLNALTVRAFNEMWFRKAPRERRDEIQPLHSFFHPLDFVNDWNRLYGSRGFVQYQFVVPFGAEATLRRIVERLSGERVASFLAVLKRFGEGTPGLLSFPMPGWTLALDMPVGRADLAAILTEFDDWVAEAGGRLYLAKDSRMTAAMLARTYPRLEEFRKFRGEIFHSDLARRLGI